MLDDAEKARLDALFEPEGWEPPEMLTAHQILALAAQPGRRGADVLAELPHDCHGLALEAGGTLPACPICGKGWPRL